MEALERIGDGWEEGQLSLSQVYMSGVICEEMIEKYIPKYSSSYKKQSTNRLLYSNNLWQVGTKDNLLVKINSLIDFSFVSIAMWDTDHIVRVLNAF